MGNRFASGKNSIAQCDRCDQRFKLTKLRREVIKGKNYELLVCPECWDPDHPQLHLGEFPVDDPQGVRNPRPDNPVGGASYFDTVLTPNNLVLTVNLGTISVQTT